jgi:hypothetical protein
LNKTLILDQANDTSDTTGVVVCDSERSGCTIESSGSHTGRKINGLYHSQQQVVYVTGVSGSGSGPYTVNISPGVYFNNIRLDQLPGAWFAGTVENDGLENMTLDHSLGAANTGIALYNCYRCWVKNVRSMYADRDHVFLYQSLNDVIRDSYFFQSQEHASQSYGIEINESSALLLENNIFQQVTNPVIFIQGSGSVVGYNYSVNEGFSNENAQTSDAGHNAGNGMNLWEGNNFFGIWADIVWGSSSTTTFFRNMLRGWQAKKTNYTMPVSLSSWNRVFNVVGNVLGQPSHATTYESYSTSSSGGVNAEGAANTSIYVLGWSGNGSPAGCKTPPVCDPIVRSTLMRWGNYDVVTSGVQWNPTEASPAARPYVNANFTYPYFASLAHTLPPSLYYSSVPSWWPATKAWPPVGPDVLSGNLGICSGTYAGAQATASGQCAGGSWDSAWAAHANSTPAQDCYLNVMGGPPDGTGPVLSFDASACQKPASSGGCGNGFLHCRSITWAASQAGTADTPTFPGLVLATEPDWADSGHGGEVQHTVTQSGGSYNSTIPADFIFASDSSCSAPMAGWEWESYDHTTGAAIVWVNIGTLSHTTNSVIWACYGKSSITTQQNTVSATWDANFVGVWHFAGNIGLQDSTSQGRALTNPNPVSTTGEIGNGMACSNIGPEFGYVNGLSLGANAVSMELWAHSSTIQSQSVNEFLELSPVNTKWQLFDGGGFATLRGGGFDGDVSSAANSLINNTWMDLAGTITGATGVNYVQAVSVSGPVSGFADTSSQFNVCAYDQGVWNFIGSVDEVRLSNTARASSYFTSRYNQEKPSQNMVSVGPEN